MGKVGRPGAPILVDGIEYESIPKAAESTGLNYGSLRSAVSRVRKTGKSRDLLGHTVSVLAPADDPLELLLSASKTRLDALMGTAPRKDILIARECGYMGAIGDVCVAFTLPRISDGITLEPELIITNAGGSNG